MHADQAPQAAAVNPDLALLELPGLRDATNSDAPAFVHPAAHVHPSAQLANGVRIGPGVVIGPDVRLAERVQVGANAVLQGRLEVGHDTRIWSGAVLGGEPQDFSFRGIPSGVRIGSHVDVREHVTVHRSTAENGYTVIGDRVMLMASSHVAHDCKVGDSAIIAGTALLAGHVHVDSRAFVSGNVAVHQFARIGRLAMIGGNSRVNRDVLPFALLVGDSQLKGLNVVGMKRAEISAAARSELRDAYRMLRTAPNFESAIDEVDAAMVSPEGRELVAFLRADSRRGFCGF